MALAITLEPIEARVLGVLIEKSLTTPDQYPLSLNALTSGCNQKSNRHPVMALSEHVVEQAVMRLRVAQLAEFVDLAHSRVERYRHRARMTLALGEAEVAVLAELLLRGAQTKGELRQRASRMHSIGTLGELEQLLRPLQDRGFVVLVPPAPGSRASRYGQLLSPDEATAAVVGQSAGVAADSLPQESGWTTPPPAGGEAADGTDAGGAGSAPAPAPRPADDHGGERSPAAAGSAGVGGGAAPARAPATKTIAVTGVAGDDLSLRVARLEARIDQLARIVERLERGDTVPPA